MQKKNIIFGGEVSGHYYFKDFYFSDSGALAALIMLQVLSQEKKKLSDLVKEISSGYHITGEINFSTKESDSLIKELKSAFKDGKQDTLDGFSVEYPDWHANIRKSNTGESVVRLSIEAKTETLLKEKKSDIVKIINKYI
jgi:phosphomannomutase